VPRVLVTDKLRSYAAAKREIMPGVATPAKPLSEQSSRSLTPVDAMVGRSISIPQDLAVSPFIRPEMQLKLVALGASIMAASQRDRQRFPHVRIDLHHMSTSRHIAALLDEEIDIGFVRRPPQFSTGSTLRHRTIWTDRLKVFFPTSQALASALPPPVEWRRE
jgi:DNA-binding transcriptional LysR family regulator